MCIRVWGFWNGMGGVGQRVFIPHFQRPGDGRRCTSQEKRKTPVITLKWNGVLSRWFSTWTDNAPALKTSVCLQIVIWSLRNLKYGDKRPRYNCVAFFVGDASLCRLNSILHPLWRLSCPTAILFSLHGVHWGGFTLFVRGNCSKSPRKVFWKL